MGYTVCVRLLMTRKSGCVYRFIQASQHLTRIAHGSYLSHVTNTPSSFQSKHVSSSVPQRFIGPNYNLVRVRWKKTLVEDIYQKKTQLEHILLRPDTYIGSVVPDTKMMWLVSEDGKHMVQKDVTYPPGLFKIFDEILVNAADNKMNDPKMTCIKIDINQSKNMVRIWNDGKGIPVIIHQKYNLYIPTLIFGHLLTSSNYDDNLKRVTGGRHGFGAKLCNTFSKKFIVETSSKEQQLCFKQTWLNNMTEAKDPVITNAKKLDYTCVTFYPDLRKFQEKSLTDDLVSLFRRRAYDVAATTKGIQVILNGETLKVNMFKDYVDMYINNSVSDVSDSVSKTTSNVVHEIINKRWEVAVTASKDGFKQTSFVNSLYTEKGGTHVKYITDKLVQALTPLVEKKMKSSGNMSPTLIKNHLWVFVNCLIENPSFNSQTKETLTSKPSDFGSDCKLTKRFISQIEDTGLIDQIVSSSLRKQVRQVDRANTRTELSSISKLEDAGEAGTRHSKKCTLIITEGDSAKATALAGIGVVGRAHYGVFPLTGKILNVRQSTMKLIMESKSIQSLIKILGLQFSQKYDTPSSLNQLRYGKIMIMADQDEDGSHIKGLIINFIHYIWPKLLENGFIVEFRTPLIKVSKGNTVLSFFNLQQYNEWKEQTSNWPNWNIKYYKGLGTSTSKEAKEYFKDMSNHVVHYLHTGKADDHMISMIFGNDPNRRKEWMIDRMSEKAPENDIIQVDQQNRRAVTYSDFINREMLQYATIDINRSIPSLADGLKVSQRKILYTCFMKKYTQREIKVLQMAASVSAFTDYHHGENSLMATIVGLAQDFVGSNNINLLLPIGQFGTRLTGGQDAAGARYIFTKLSPLTMIAFNSKDFPLLEYSYFDEQPTEPVCYYPILPMVLINGASGIATGWNTKIFNYDVRDVVENLHLMLDGHDPLPMIPSYRKFQGTIERKQEEEDFRICGQVEIVDNNTVAITELPVRVWTQSYKDKILVPFLNAGKIKNFREEHTDTTVRFVVEMNVDQTRGQTVKDYLQYFKLEKNVSSNMVLLDEKGVLKNYKNTSEIFKDFFELRWKMYEKRKAYFESYLEAERSYLDNRVRFITEKIDGKLKIENKKLEEVTQILHESGYSTYPLKAWKSKNKETQTEETPDTEEIEPKTSQQDDFDYLFNMPLYTLTYEHKEKLVKKLAVKQNELQSLKAKTVKDLWKEDLNEFMELYEKEDQAVR